MKQSSSDIVFYRFVNGPDTSFRPGMNAAHDPNYLSPPITLTTETVTSSTAAGSVHGIEFRIMSRAQVRDVTIGISLIPPLLLDLPNQTFVVGETVNLALPEAAGGVNPYTYTLTGTLPDGLSFGTTTRTISGTTTTATAAAEVTYTVTDSAPTPTTTSRPFTITVVNAALALPELPNRTFVVGETVNLTLPEATGGDNPYTYTLTGTLPDGLSFDTTTRILSGTTTTAAAAVTLTYAVTDSATTPVTASQPFTITVNPVLVLPVPPNPIFIVGETVNLTLPDNATGGVSPYIYTLAGTLPTGLSFDTTTRTLSGTTTTAAAATLTYTVTDSATTPATTGQPFTITVDTTLALPVPPALTFVVGETANLTLPDATGGTPSFFYTLTGTLPDGLSFDTTTRSISGSPTTAIDADVEVTYTVTDSDTPPVTTDQTFTITVIAPSLLVLPNPPDQTYVVGEEIDFTLPAATGGTPSLTYDISGAMPKGLTFSPGSESLPSGLGFDATSRAIFGISTPAADDPVTYTVTYTVTDSATVPVTDSQTFTMTIESSEATALNSALNRVILPKLTRAIAGQTSAAISRRIRQAESDNPTPASVTLAGQSSLAAIASTHAQTLTDDTHNLKNLLAGSGFVLPLNAGDGAANGLSSVAFWGSGDYLDLSDESGTIDWDGDLASISLGVDARLRADLLGGVAVTRSESDLGYKITGATPIVGDYELSMTSVNPYLGWRAGRVDLWATVGYGTGDLEITSTGQARTSTDVDMQTVAAGVGGQIMDLGNGGTLRLKGELSQASIDVDGNPTGNIVGEDVYINRVRVSLEATRPQQALANEAWLEPLLEAGVRHDGGDGETGVALELNAGIRYGNPAHRITLEGRVHTLVARDNYDEWGINGTIRLQPGKDGQGSSLSLQPGYGEGGGGIQALWDKGLPEDTQAKTDYGMRLDARLGYGLSTTLGSHAGMLTPYSEMTLAETDSYRLGIRWDMSRYGLDLVGEHYQSNTNPAENAILLKGEIRF